MRPPPRLALAVLCCLAAACSKKASVEVKASAHGELEASSSAGPGSAPSEAHSWQGDAPDPAEGRLAEPQAAGGEPIATLPGFRMFRDGRSRVFVEVGARVPVEESKSQGQLVYRLKGVRVPEKVNRYDLPTTYFNSPVSRVHLVQAGEDAQLIIELRQPTTSRMNVNHDEGATVLSVDFPPLGEAAPASG